MIEIRNNIPDTESRITFHGVELKSPIPSAIPRASATLKDKIIVIFHFPKNQFKNLSTANAFAFDKKGEVLWTVEAYAPYQDLFRDNYVDFSLDEAGLILGTFIGHRAYLNTDNGRITAIDVGRAW